MILLSDSLKGDCEQQETPLFRLRTPWRLFSLLLITSLILPVLSARAQGTAFSAITPPDTSKFPIITTLLDAFDDQGNFLTGLNPDTVAVLEDGQQIKPDKLELLQPPLSFTVAVSSDPALALRDAYGASRYDKLIAVLNNWVAARPADSQDKLALVWNGGVIASHLSPSEWKTRLDSFDPALRNSTTSLSALAFALDVAQETETGPGVKKSILLISAHLSRQDQNALDGMINRAKQIGVYVYVWMTDSNAFLDNSGAQALQDLALATGGRYTAFTGSETIPDPEEWLSPLRNVYQLTYSSNIRTGGQHTLMTQVHSDSLSLGSPPVDFSLEVQPPSAALLSLPIQIVRQNPEKPFEIESFLPTEQEISMLVEFPDGMSRPLTRTTLYVDGQKAGENIAEPFNRFSWDLSGYIASGAHSLRVEVEDSLGLSSMSAEVPVQVTVVQPPGGIAGFALRNQVAVTLVIMVLAGAVLLGIIFLGGRKGLATLAERRRARAARLDPLTQPVTMKVEAAGASRANPFPWLRRKAPAPLAYFVKLTSDGAPAQGDPIPLGGHEMTFGTDPTQSTTVLDDPSLSPLHARLRHDDQGFLLLDQNSVAGTWVDYEPICREGRVLKHGDVINFGQLTYRFVLTKTPSMPKPTITPNSTH